MKRTGAQTQPSRHAAATAPAQWPGVPALRTPAQRRCLRAAALFTHRWTEGSVAGALAHEGIELHTLRSIAEWVAALQTADFDVAIIEDHGRQLASCLATLRFRGATTVPIIAVGGGSTEQFSAALRLGVTDYAITGESAQTLANRVLARIEVCRQTDQRTLLHVGPCTLDAHTRTLCYTGGELQLTWREFAFAWVLFENVGQVVHLRRISWQVWGADVTVAKRTIEQHVYRLRHKLSHASESEEMRLVLHAVTNVGYRLVAEPLSYGPGDPGPVTPAAGH